MGFPDSLYDELFGDSPMVAGPQDPLKIDTELVVELGLVAEFAGGSMREWEERSWAERRMWVYFKMLQNKKISKAEQDSVDKMKNENSHVSSMPPVVHDRPGIRRR